MNQFLREREKIFMDEEREAGVYFTASHQAQP